jgi:hypothetical protein
MGAISKLPNLTFANCLYGNRRNDLPLNAMASVRISCHREKDYGQNKLVN